MKKLILVVAVFVFAVGSAFTTKVVDNPIGWAHISSGDVHAPTDNANCTVKPLGTSCSIFVVGTGTISTVYDSQGDIGLPGKVMRF
jgi:hypothetical protein